MYQLQPVSWLRKGRRIPASILSGLRGVVFFVLIAVLSLVHPFVHNLEGGTLDAVLDYMIALGAQLSAQRS